MNILLSGSSPCIPGSRPTSLLFFYLFYFLVFVLIHCDLKFLLKDNLTTFWRSTVVIITFVHCVLISLAYGNINHFFVKRKLKKHLFQLSWILWFKIADCNHFLWNRALRLRLGTCCNASHSFPGFGRPLLYQLLFRMDGTIQHLAFFACFISFNRITRTSIHTAADNRTLRFLMAD